MMRPGSSRGWSARICFRGNDSSKELAGGRGTFAAFRSAYDPRGRRNGLSFGSEIIYCHRSLDPAVQRVLEEITPGSARHLAVVESVRLAVQRAAKSADQADKQRALKEL